MVLKLSHMLSTSGLQHPPLMAQHDRLELIRRTAFEPKPEEDESLEEADTAAPAARRTRIWEFDTNLHCSIIGTCLTTTELRHSLEKLKVDAAATVSDHDLHAMGVILAGRRQEGAKFLQKALDRRHRAAIMRYARAKDEATLLGFWEESLKQGDIPGAYWAALTHPAATETVVKRVFGDVHMLSHLVGAANRADIRRLRQLEADNVVLAGKVERQQRQLQEGFAARDQTIRRLNAMLARQADAAPAAPAAPAALDGGENRGDAEDVIRDLNRRFAREMARRERAEEQARGLAATLAEREREVLASRRECAAAREELDVVEQQLVAFAQPEAAAGEGTLALTGVTLLYVGGRAHQVPQLKGLIERAGGAMLHHDGGIEHSAALLPGLMSRADHVVFPVDCISHDAVATIKRVCRTSGKSYAPLRTASLACLFAALMRMRASCHGVAAE